MIVTANLRDFPTEALAEFEIDAQHPDEFVLHLLDPCDIKEPKEEKPRKGFP